MEAINRPWHFTASGRLVTAVGKRVKDEKLVYVDSTGSWCKSDGTYQTPGEPRPMQHSALLDKQLDTARVGDLLLRCRGAGEVEEGAHRAALCIERV